MPPTLHGGELPFLIRHPSHGRCSKRSDHPFPGNGTQRAKNAPSSALPPFSSPVPPQVSAAPLLWAGSSQFSDFSMEAGMDGSHSFACNLLKRCVFNPIVIHSRRITLDGMTMGFRKDRNGEHQAWKVSCMLPWNNILIFFMTLFLIQWLCELFLGQLNMSHSKKNQGSIPQPFKEVLDEEAFGRMTAYTIESQRLSACAGAVSQIILFLLIFTGFLGGAAHFLATLSMPLYLEALCFFLVPGALLYVASLPFDHHETFVLEEKYGFNRSTKKIWVMDHIKSLLVTIILFALVLGVILFTMTRYPSTWWLWAFGALSAIQITLVLLYPVVIAPLFNTFEPIKNEELRLQIVQLMEDNGIKVKRVLQMDAGLRSGHTNAYFTGLGKTKHIVLYDTLLETHTQQEILAVLAHEAGHFKKNHLPRQLILALGSMFLVFFGIYLLLSWPPFLTTFGFQTTQMYAGLFLAGIFWQKAAYFLQPLPKAVSRHFEREADRYAAKLMGSPQPMIQTLKRLAADNLANLNPHPWYVFFNYSHPPIVERIEHLERFDSP